MHSGHYNSHNLSHVKKIMQNNENITGYTIGKKSTITPVVQESYLKTTLEHPLEISQMITIFLLQFYRLYEKTLPAFISASKSARSSVLSGRASLLLAAALRVRP